jgi:hypothetical protein
MVKRLVLTILLGICFVAIVGTEAPAFFCCGYGGAGYSTYTGNIGVVGGKNSVVTVDAVMTLQHACETQGQGNYSLGESFLQTAQAEVEVAKVAFLDEGGEQRVPYEIELDEWESDDNCQNTSGWKHIDGSIGLLSVYFIHTHTRCVGKGENPCDELAKKPFDVVIVECLDMEILRDEDGKTLPGQDLTQFCDWDM